MKSAISIIIFLIILVIIAFAVYKVFSSSGRTRNNYQELEGTEEENADQVDLFTE